MTQAEMAERLSALLGCPVSRQTAQRTLARMGYTRKKALTASQQHRPDVAAERETFLALQPTLDASKLVFLDERGLRRGMRSPYGYAWRGQCCYEVAPFRIGRRLGPAHLAAA